MVDLGKARTVTSQDSTTFSGINQPDRLGYAVVTNNPKHRWLKPTSRIFQMGIQDLGMSLLTFIHFVFLKVYLFI